MRVEEAIGRSEAFLAFTERLSRAAAVDRPVLLIGERGTGKELAAAKLHYLSRRWEGPLVALNCAALAPALVEAELFGHEQGAFTGATRERAGRFEAADGGTLLLDEIGLVPIEAQEKLLRVVEYGTFERVGSSRQKRLRCSKPTPGRATSANSKTSSSGRSTVPISGGVPVDPSAVPGRSTLPASLPEAVARLEIEALRGALLATRHHQRKAAALLGLSYHQFRGLYRKHATHLEE